MTRLFAVLALMTVSVCACGNEAPAPAPAPAATAETTTQSTEAAPAPQATTQTQQSETEQATSAQESVADATADDRDQSALTLERLAALPAAQQLPSGKWKAGVSYTPIVPAQPTNVPSGKVEVTEFFWYGCSHCFALEPYLQKWDQSKAEYIELVRVPVMWGPVHRAHAQLFYTLQALGREDLHQKVFETIHKANNMLVANDANRTLALQTEFAKANGINPDEFRKAYNSFSVKTNLERADEMMRRYRIESVPQLAVNGKYLTDVGKAGGHEKLLSLLNDLAASEKR